MKRVILILILVCCVASFATIGRRAVTVRNADVVPQRDAANCSSFSVHVFNQVEPLYWR